MKKKINNFSGNVPTWLALADINIDYYIQFVKQWIPFNAWYIISYSSDILTNDRLIIDHIKNTPNPFRDRVISLLEGHDNISVFFKNEIAQLHEELEAHKIPNHESKISFASINIEKNLQTQGLITHRNLSYKTEFNITAPRNTKRIKCQIFDNKHGSRTVYIEEFYEWSITDLKSSDKFKELSKERQNQLINCFEQINPLKQINVLSNPTKLNKNNCTLLNSEKETYFIEDKIIISKVVIEILYLLRNALFHGELNPTKTNQIIYEHAFNILKILIQELK